MTTSPFERYLTYGVLAVFSAMALVPLVGVVLAALHPSGELLVRVEPAAARSACTPSAWPGTRATSKAS